MSPLRTPPAPLVAPALPALLRASSMLDVERLAQRERELHRLHPGLAAVQDPDAAPAVARRDLVLARVAATAQRLTTQYWFSHQTAALLHGLWTYRLADRVHLTQLHPPPVRRERDSWEHRHRLTRHWTALPERDRDRISGLPVTTLERTAVDCARSLSLAAALPLMDCALRHGADDRVIAQILEESRGKRGVVRARRVLELADAGAESPGESLVRLALIEEGLGRPETQVRVGTALGDKWVDVGWPRARVGVEFDGEVKYGELAGGDPDGVRRRQAVRQAAIEDQGWRIERAGWDDVEDPGPMLARVRGALSGRWSAFTA